MKKSLLTISAILAVVFSMSIFSCKPEDDTDKDNDVKDSIPTSIDNYLPTTTGSWWLYNSSTGKQYKRESTGKDSLRGGLTMKYFTYTDLSISDPNPEYFNRFDGDKYYTLFTLDSSTVDPTYIPIIIMKDDPTVGMSWVNEGTSSTAGYGDVTMRLTFTVESLTETIATDDSTFTNAIKVKGVLKGKNAVTTWVDCGTITYWFVKRVGMVQQDYNIELKMAGITLYQDIHLDVLKNYNIAY